MIGPIMDVYAAIAGAPQPVVGAVQGAALGFGCALATACDITIATDDSRFSLPELEKNFPPTLAISAMMARVPRKALTWMVYSTGEIDARTALQLGIVSSVVAKSALEAETGKLMTGLATRSREVLTGVKDYMRAAPSMDPRGAADYASNLLAADVVDPAITAAILPALKPAPRHSQLCGRHSLAGLRRPLGRRLERSGRLLLRVLPGLQAFAMPFLKQPDDLTRSV
jgi:enoyl-CoA hydratase/carnithine racemase